MQHKSTVEIPLSSKKYTGLHALVDEDDYELVSQHRWFPTRSSTSRTFYAGRFEKQRDGKRVIILMHREINKTPQDLETDHINGDGLDNRRENLRSVERSQNLANAHTPIRSKTGYIGVIFDDWSNKPYKAVVRGATVGRFRVPEEAAREVDRYRRIIWGEHVKLNFPDERDKLDEVIRGYNRKKQNRHSERYRGVYYDKGRRKWEAQITHNGNRVKIGRFLKLEEAALAYDRARVERGLSPVNFPPRMIDE